MFQLTKATEYSILFLLALATIKDRPLSLVEIVKEQNLPLKYLEKIAKKLKDNGIVVSKEGVGGGYLLTRKVNKINLIDIVQAVEGKKGLVNCIHGYCATQDSCLQKSVWQKLQSKLEKEVRKITLSDLII